jgi:hypothetical protein
MATAELPNELRATTTEVLGDRLDRLQSTAVMLAVVGAILAVLGFAVNRAVGFTNGGIGFIEEQSRLVGFLHSYLYAYGFWLGVTAGSLGLLMLHHTVGGGWGFVIRRFLEAGSRLLFPLMVVLFVPIGFGVFAGLYEWNTPQGMADEIVKAKLLYLNPTRFFICAVLFFAVWIAYSVVLNNLGRTHDERADRNVSAKLNVIGASGILVYVLTMTFASVDWLLSIEPRWASSIWGLLTVASQALSTFSLMLLLISVLLADRPVVGLIPTGYFRDLGNLTLATVMFWGYLSFSQYLITYSGNTTEEIVWYIQRRQNGWGWISLGLIAFHFFVPFFWLLLGSNVKRDPRRLAQLATWIIVMRFIDLWWWVTPKFRDQISISLTDLGTPLLIGGIWLWFWVQQVRGKTVVPLHDPRFEAHLQEIAAHGAH